MNITDRVIRKWIEENAGPQESLLSLIYAPKPSPVETFLKQQKSTDIIRYINSKKPVEESFLETAIEVCADRAGMTEEFLNCDADTFPEIWDRIEEKLRREQRAAAQKKRAEKKEPQP